MFKKTLAVVILAALSFILVSCSNTQNFYNDFYGLRVELPKDFNVEEAVAENISEKKGDTKDSSKFAVSFYNGDIETLDFLFAGNLADFNDPGYVQLYIYGVTKNNFLSFDEYITFVKTIDLEASSYSMEVRDDGNAEINGVSYRKIVKTLHVYETEEKFIEEFYIIDKEDAYLNIYLFYTEGNEEAAVDAPILLNSVFVE